MMSRKLTSGFNIWSCVTSAWPWCIWIPNLVHVALPNSELLTFTKIQDGGRCHVGFFKSCTFATFRHVNSVMLQIYIKFGSNICFGHWDRRTYASDVPLMTSRELTSDFDFWSHGHLRMAVMHLSIKFGSDIFIQSGVIDIFPKFKMAAAAILDFQIMRIWPFRRVDSVAFVFCTKLG